MEKLIYICHCIANLSIKQKPYYANRFVNKGWNA